MFLFSMPWDDNSITREVCDGVKARPRSRQVAMSFRPGTEEESRKHRLIKMLCLLGFRLSAEEMH